MRILVKLINYNFIIIELRWPTPNSWERRVVEEEREEDIFLIPRYHSKIHTL